MPFALRLLREADIYQCADIEREAFPSQFPPTSFRRELKNRMASYLVALARDEAGAEPAATPPPGGERTLAGTLVRTARMLWDGGGAHRDEGQDLVAGFLGTWYMVDEAHIVSVGVRRQYRGLGVGELLLIGAVEHALTRDVAVVTLEVRSSNAVARNLYRKYGFEDRGLRKGYYADDREDAIIMTTPPIRGHEFQDLFQVLRREHQERWGPADRELV